MSDAVLMDSNVLVRSAVPSGRSEGDAPVDLLDTTEIALEETGARVGNWLRVKPEQAENR